MSEVVNRYLYYFNSHAAENYNKNTPFCEFLLNQPLNLSHPLNVFEVSIPRAMIPYTFYQFSAARNSVSLFFTIGASNHQISIPDGNYNILQLASIVSATIQAYLVSLGYGSAVLITSYNDTSNRLSFDLSNPTSLTLSFSYSRLGEALGFITPFTLTSGILLVSAIDCNVAPINMLFIFSTFASNGESYEQLNTSNKGTDYISSIPIIHSSKYYIPFEPANPLKTRVVRDTISKLDFTIEDNNGDELVNFPLAWTFVVQIEELNIKSLFDHPTSKQQETSNQVLSDNPVPQVNELDRIHQKSLNTLNQIQSELLLAQNVPKQTSSTSTSSQINNPKKRKQ